MLKIEVGKDVGIHVEATGQVKDIITDISIAFNVLYHQMTAGNPDAQSAIKKMLQFVIMDDSSLFWKDIDIGSDATAIRIEIPQK